MDYVQHHDDLYRSHEGDYLVDHHDTYGHEHIDDDWKV